MKYTELAWFRSKHLHVFKWSSQIPNSKSDLKYTDPCHSFSVRWTLGKIGNVFVCKNLYFVSTLQYFTTVVHIFLIRYRCRLAKCAQSEGLGTAWPVPSLPVVLSLKQLETSNFPDRIFAQLHHWDQCGLHAHHYWGNAPPEQKDVLQQPEPSCEQTNGQGAGRTWQFHFLFVQTGIRRRLIGTYYPAEKTEALFS